MFFVWTASGQMFQNGPPEVGSLNKKCVFLFSPCARIAMAPLLFPINARSKEMASYDETDSNAGSSAKYSKYEDFGV